MLNTKQVCAAVAFGWAWPALIILLVTGDAKALLLLIAAPVMGSIAWRMSGTQMRKHGGRQLWPPVGALAAVVACLLLAGCGSTGKAPNPNSVAGQRAQQAAEKASAPIPTPQPTSEPQNPPQTQPEATNDAIAEAVPAYDGFTAQALPYGGLAALQFLIMAVATLTHPHGRRVGIGLASFALCAAAALLALAYAQPIDLIGFVVVCVMALVAMARVFGQSARPVAAARSVIHG